MGFDPSEPRDKEGKWTSGGASHTSVADKGTHAKRSTKVQAASNVDVAKEAAKSIATGAAVGAATEFGVAALGVTGAVSLPVLGTAVLGLGALGLYGVYKTAMAETLGGKALSAAQRAVLTVASVTKIGSAAEAGKLTGTALGKAIKAGAPQAAMHKAAVAAAAFKQSRAAERATPVSHIPRMITKG